MNGIKMSNCKFYVNEEERVVVCVIPQTKDMLITFVREHFKWDDIDIIYFVYVIKKGGYCSIFCAKRPDKTATMRIKMDNHNK